MIPIELWQQKFEQMHGPGEVMHGSAMSDEQAIQWAEERFGGRYCIVREWVWRHLVGRDQLLPGFIYANHVVYDSEARFQPGDWVRTSLLCEFSEGFIFQARKTAYILLGLGYRTRPGLKLVKS